MIRHLSKYLPIKTLILMYKSLIRPHLDYCDIIFHIPPNDNGIFTNVNNNVLVNGSLNALMTKVERIQYQAALAVTGCWKGTSRNKLYEELGWESLAHRRWARRLIHFFKVVSTRSPDYLYQSVPPTRMPIYGTGSNYIFHEIRFNKNKYIFPAP